MSLRVNIKIAEVGATRRRLRVLAEDLHGTLSPTQSVDVEFLSQHSGDDPGIPKGPAELVPGALAVSVALTAGISRLARILETWLTRDRYRTIRIENPATGEIVNITGFSADEIAHLLEGFDVAGEVDGRAYPES